MLVSDRPLLFPTQDYTGATTLYWWPEAKTGFLLLALGYDATVIEVTRFLVARRNLPEIAG